MEKENLSCLTCGALATQMKEASGGSYRQYGQIIRKLMELERQGDMELVAGDCPLEEPLYAVPQLWSPLFCGSLHPGCAGLSAGGLYQEGKPGHPAVGPVRNLLWVTAALKDKHVLASPQDVDKVRNALEINTRLEPLAVAKGSNLFWPWAKSAFCPAGSKAPVPLGIVCSAPPER